jgi:hypothetical protein
VSAARRAVALLFAAAGLVACGPKPAPRAFAGALPAWSEGARFAIVGDTQRTGAVEFWRETNDAERRAVLEAVAAERPAFVAFTGDLVFSGASDAAWADFDAIASPLHDARLPAIGTPGNHDTWGDADARRFFERFPAQQGEGALAARFGPIAIVLVDSNLDAMSEAAWTDQAAWLARTLDALDRDPSVRGVLLLAHHPPFTNSTVTKDEEHVAEGLVPPFLAARKTLAMVTGHVHSYERFQRDGRAFVVSGGGGGPRAKLLVGDARRHRDDLFPGPALRGFGFLLVTVHEGGAVVELRGLDKGGRAVTTRDRFELPFRR